MSDARWRARSVPEIVDAAFQLYRQNWSQYILVSAVASAPWLIIELLTIRRPGAAGTPTTPAEALHGLTATMAVMLGGWLSQSLMSAVVLKLGSHAYLGEAGTGDVAAAVRDVLPRVPAILIAGLIKYVALVVGFFLFFVGLLYFAARFFAVYPAVVLENKGPIACFGRSGELSKGHKGHILGTLILVWVIYVILSVAVSAFATFMGSVVLLLVASYAYGIVGYPFIGLTELVLYYDARIRNEGLDVELMAGTLAPAAPEA